MQEENKIVAMRYNAKLGEWVEVKELSGALPVWDRNGKCLDCGAAKGVELELSRSLSAEEIEERLVTTCSCLQSLSLYRTNISDAGLKHVAKLINLKKLILVKTKISDDWLKHIVKLINLVTLNLMHTKISDEGLKHITDFINLEEFDLSVTNISDEGLKHLAGLINLKRLYLTGSKISDEGLKHLA